MNHTDPTAAVTVCAQTISVLVTGQPDIPNKYGTGAIRPRGVRLNYRGQQMDARVDGYWVRESGEVTDHPLDQHYWLREATDVAAWPDWLCALASALRPSTPAVPVVVSPPPDHAALRDRIAEAIWAQYSDAEPSPTGLVMANPHAVADAVLAVLPESGRAATLLDAAEAIDAETRQLKADGVLEPDKFRPCRNASEQLRRLAAEAPQPVVASEPSAETPTVTPNPEGGVILHLPEITYLDTQVWAADIGLTHDGLAALRAVLNGAEAPQPDTEAHPPQHSWRVETYDPDAGEWAPGSHFLRREAAVERYDTANSRAPQWADGTPTERRIVRETTTYTVEQPDTEAQQQPPASLRNRRAFVHNAITEALSAAGDWVPLSVRIAATRAALAEVDAWHAAAPPPAVSQPAADDGEETR